MSKNDQTRRKTFYAVRVKKTQKYLGISVTSNPDSADFCNSYSAEWVDYGPPHLFKSQSTLEKVLADPPGVVQLRAGSAHGWRLKRSRGRNH